MSGRSLVRFERVVDVLEVKYGEKMGERNFYQLFRLLGVSWTSHQINTSQPGARAHAPAHVPAHAPVPWPTQPGASSVLHLLGCVFLNPQQPQEGDPLHPHFGDEVVSGGSSLQSWDLSPGTLAAELLITLLHDFPVIFVFSANPELFLRGR